MSEREDHMTALQGSLADARRAFEGRGLSEAVEAIDRSAECLREAERWLHEGCRRAARELIP